MAISADSIYSETLQSIINAKLAELVKKKQAFESSKAAVQKSFASETDEAQRVRILRDGVKTCFTFGSGYSSGGMNIAATDGDLVKLLKNLDRFLEQPRYDPSVSSHQLQAWGASLGHYFDVQSKRYAFASMYAQLVTEWLSAEKRLGEKKDGSDVQMTESFEEVDGAAKLQSRLDWEQSVFNPPDVKVEGIKAYLKALFDEDGNNKELTKALKDLRGKVSAFMTGLASSQYFNANNLRWTIRGLLAGDLLSEEKCVVLRDCLNNPVIISEIADVLNLRMASIDNWSWGPAVPVEQRKKLAGQYSIFMHEDLLQAIFLQLIGVMWSVFLKSALRDLVKAKGAWINSRWEPSKLEWKRMEYYLGGIRRQPTLHSKRSGYWFQRYFLTQLQTSHDQHVTDDDGAEEADYGFMEESSGRTKQTARKSTGGKAPRKQMASGLGSGGAKRHRKILRDNSKDVEADYEDHDNASGVPQSTMALKQGLLHVLQTEILLNTQFHGGVTAFRAQFDSWNSLLPHETTLAVAEYLGVSDTWLTFFRSFLRAPLSFMTGGAGEEPRTRLRGVPSSHPLSDVLGELVLFCLDMSVNQATGGQKMWRVHDDMWFWSPNQSTTVKAWTTITEFCDVMGLVLDSKRAGSIRIDKEQRMKVKIDPSLPQDRIRWGFLFLDPLTGQWEVEQAFVDSHIDELRRQLDAKSESLLSWIQAWNAYASTFFTSNFGPPAVCLGRGHIEKALTSLERVQRRLYEGDSSNNVVEYLKSRLQQRFEVGDIPEGYCFFPTELGGLELKNPFVGLLLVYDALDKRSDPNEIIERFMEGEQEGYETAKSEFEEGKTNRYSSVDPDWEPEGEDKDVFMSFEEFIKYREVIANDYYEVSSLDEVYKELLQKCTERDVEATSDISTALELMDSEGMIKQSSGINADWDGMTPYWKWVTQMYGGEIVKQFGGLNIVDNGVLPIGMVSLFRSDRVQWKG